eukprot:5709162-Prymnesium_polylepis.3
MHIGCILIKVYQDTALDDPELASRVLGFSSTDEIVALLLASMLLMLLILNVTAIYTMQRDALVPTFRLIESGAPPELTLTTGQHYHGL